MPDSSLSIDSTKHDHHSAGLDLSSDAAPPTLILPQEEDNVRLQLAHQQVRHRDALFSIAIASAIMMYIVLVGFIISLQTNINSHKLAAIAILAAMPASVMLALMKFVFRREKEHEEVNPTDVAPLLTLIKQIGEVIKDVWPRKA